jgi:hypothetical protein
MHKFILLVIVVILSSISLGHADISPDERKEIEKLLRLTGVEKLVGQWKPR